MNLHKIDQLKLGKVLLPPIKDYIEEMYIQDRGKNDFSQETANFYNYLIDDLDNAIKTLNTPHEN